MKSFTLEPKYQKCIVEVEIWKKDHNTIERVINWRFGKITILSESLEAVSAGLAERNSYKQVDITKGFDVIDQDIQDSCSDDLYFPDDMPEKEQSRLIKLFRKKGESMFEIEGWEISETKLLLVDDITIESGPE